MSTRQDEFEKLALAVEGHPDTEMLGDFIRAVGKDPIAAVDMIAMMLLTSLMSDSLMHTDGWRALSEGARLCSREILAEKAEPNVQVESQAVSPPERTLLEQVRSALAPFAALNTRMEHRPRGAHVLNANQLTYADVRAAGYALFAVETAMGQKVAAEATEQAGQPPIALAGEVASGGDVTRSQCRADVDIATRVLAGLANAFDYEDRKVAESIRAAISSGHPLFRGYCAMAVRQAIDGVPDAGRA